MLYIRLLCLKWRHLYNGALIYSKNIFHFLTFQTFKLPKRAAKNMKNMTSFPCFVRPEKFHPYVNWIYVMVLGTHCQQLGDICMSVGFCFLSLRNIHSVMYMHWYWIYNPIYGWNFSGRTELEFGVIFFVFLSAFFGNL